MIQALASSLERTARRLRLVIGRGKISQSDDTGTIQKLQIVLSSEETADIPRAAEFGLASWPPDNCGAVVVFIGGDRSNGVAIATHDLKSRFKLANKGEAALHDANGQDGVAGKWIWLKKGAGIEIEANGEPVVVKDASAVTISPKAGQECAVTIGTGGGDVVLNMGGGNVTISNPGAVVLGPANKAVVVDGDPVSGGVVHSTQTVVKA